MDKPLVVAIGTINKSRGNGRAVVRGKFYKIKKVDCFVEGRLRFSKV